MRGTVKILTVVLAAGLMASPVLVLGQADPVESLRRQVASLTQDVNILRSQVGALQLDLEDTRRQNANLRQQVEAMRAASGQQQDVMRLVDARLAELRAELLRANATNRTEIINTVTRQVESLAKQTEESMRRIASAVQQGSRPAAATPVTFSSDYPKTGIPYTVQPGDTISGIAARHNSRTNWIRDANQIVDPNRDLRVGANIFIPQEPSQ